MSSYERISDTETVNVGANSTAQSGRFEVGDRESATIVLVGDANSTDVSVNYMAAESSGAGLGEVQRALQTGNNFNRDNLDLTSYSNNKIVLENLPVEGINQIAVELTDASGTATDVDVTVISKEIV